MVLRTRFLTLILASLYYRRRKAGSIGQANVSEWACRSTSVVPQAGRDGSSSLESRRAASWPWKSSTPAIIP
ncbi:hypothetical protein PIB30_077370 [Stylosanthes scabra]|uniref:Secreted protein n=1 Tax=Stylosanthes scabra TaxID=79078 RepID=A0ABU6QRD0_9FABA|nr:hypothetical protein [Stylosanthes scabra]